MTKSELIERIARDAGLTKTQAEHAIESVFADIERSLKKHDKVKIAGFGTFSAGKRGARFRRAQTDRSIEVPARRSLKFNPGDQLKKALRG